MKKILIFKPDNIGDVVLLSGALRHFRRLFPRAEITLAVKKHIINLVELCPHIDRVVAVESFIPYYEDAQFSGRVLLHRTFFKTRRFLMGRYDVVLYPVRAPQSKHLGILKGLLADAIVGIVGCRVNAPNGYQQGLAPEDIFTDALDVSGRDPWEHEFYVLQAFLNRLGAEISNLSQLMPEFWFSPHDHSLLGGQNVGGGPIVGIFPFSSGEERCWPLDRYLPVLQAVPGVRKVAIFAGSDRCQSAAILQADIQAGLPAEVLNFAGKTTLRQLAQTISDCSVLVSVDSSGLHLGLAGGTPTVGILGGGHYGMFAPWVIPVEGSILTNRLDCFHCNWRCVRETRECIHGVEPHAVAAAMKALLHRQESQNHANE